MWFWGMFSKENATGFELFQIHFDVILCGFKVMLKWFWSDVEACIANIEHMLCFENDFEVMGDFRVILIPA